MLTKFDALLSRITMYKLVLWGLRILAAISISLSFFGVLDLPWKAMVLSLVLLSVSSYLTNTVLSRVWRVPTNTDSYPITLLILFFILPPATTELRAAMLILAGIVAMASKFVMAVQGKHIFNPAGFSAGLLGLLGLIPATWWVGSSVLWPFTLLLGVIVVRKLRRFSMVGAFALVSILTTLALAIYNQQVMAETLRFALISSPFIFLGTIMLTEPSTMPGRRRQQIFFGALVGLLYAARIDFGSFDITPEIALLIGNVYAFYVSPRMRLQLKLTEIQKISSNVYNYVFRPNTKADYLPGQYMEWTLDHKSVYGRGNRRTFSIASSPTEDTIQLGVKFYEPSSTYKKALKSLDEGQNIFAGQIAGDFVLPNNTKEKLAFLAGGIGITPFRSMLKYLVDTNQNRDIVLIYTVSNPSEMAYRDVLEASRHHGVRVIRLLTATTSPTDWHGEQAPLDDHFIGKHIPDYKERLFYISGPNGMVVHTKKILSKMKIQRIKTDYFTGY